MSILRTAGHVAIDGAANIGSTVVKAGVGLAVDAAAALPTFMLTQFAADDPALQAQIREAAGGAKRAITGVADATIDTAAHGVTAIAKEVGDVQITR